MPKGSGSRLVHDTIRRRILTLEFQPGMELDESRLVEMLGVSRTPVREALIRLGSEGLVVLLPNRSARVSSIDLANLREFFESLDLCQRATARWAALRRSDLDLAQMRRHMVAFEEAAARRDSDTMIEANRDFHTTVAAAAGNAYIAAAYARLLNEGLRVSRLAVTYDFDRSRSLAEHLDQIIAEHRQFVVLIEAGDAEGAEELAGAHAALGRNRVIENVTNILSSGVRIKSYGGA